MSSPILLVGAAGNMGQRYQAIFRYLKIEYYAVDILQTPNEIRELAKESSGVLIATPTDTHAKLVDLVMMARKPIMCEKPITKNIPELKRILKDCTKNQVPFRMINQYKILTAGPYRSGVSYYDYFKHGNDGLEWDCIQVIQLSKTAPHLSENSPIWKCAINGHNLSLQHMDMAYIEYVRHWLEKPKQDFGEILEAHIKASLLHKEAREREYENDAS